MSASDDHLFVLGYFPPPMHGQSIMTRRVADLLRESFEVTPINLSPGEGYPGRFQRARHYWSMRGSTRRKLEADPNAPVLWTSISTKPPGHFRDMTTILPALSGRRSVYCVLHRANFDQLFRSPLTHATILRLARNVKLFVFLDDRLSEKCARWLPPEQRAVIPNTVDDAVLCSDDACRLKQEHRRTRNEISVLFLSNMMVEKGYVDVLAAIGELSRRGLAVRGVFAGEWPSAKSRTSFDADIIRRGLTDNIEVLGRVDDRTRVRDLYLAADVFVLPSYHPTEAQPVTIIEAMNAATPAIVTAQGGIPRMVTDKQEGILVNPRDPIGIADAIETLGDYPTWLAYSTAARARFKAAYSPDSVRRKWIALLAADREAFGSPTSEG